MTVGFFVFVISAIGAWTGMHYYVFRSLAAIGMNRNLLTAALWFLALTFPITRLLTFRWRHPFLGVIHWIGAVWIGSVFLLSFWLFVAWVARNILSIAGVNAAVDPAPWIATTTAVVLAMILWGLYRARSGPQHAYFEVDRYARYGKGRQLRVVQISDVHLGLTLGIGFLDSLVERINCIEPDVVFITGDFIDPEFPDDGAAAESLRKLRPREGTYAISGNHEFYAGIGRFMAMMGKAGIPVLDNEVKILSSGLQVAGIHDQTANRFSAQGITCDLAKALVGVDRDAPSILLAHQPKDLEPATAKRIDLILSGHTHAGQIFPFNAMVRMVYRYLGGVYRLGPDTELIVCTGTGFWGPPLRLGTESQIVVVDFKF